ncbi:hypothetical protein LAZ67_12001104 [Cordylochernes scorpioides]|uniref:Reverse transcriptase domain-containing protein n=1 Tax=Cordylochernes scorpioides TaxID=51811 RepID=A0ABY6L112_9ARAC|nr:hypothetical protein LAZ67_12001104 [Cordylochernes scorpioides]
MISFDVESLYPSLPHQLILSSTEEFLRENKPNLQVKHAQQKPALIVLLKQICVTNSALIGRWVLGLSAGGRANPFSHGVGQTQAAPNMEYKRGSSCIPGLGALTGYYQPGQLSSGFHRRVKAKTSLQDDNVPIDDTTTKPLFTPQEKGRKGTRDKVPRLRWNPWEKHAMIIMLGRRRRLLLLFKAGRISIEDDPRQGRPTFQRTDENVQKITDLIKENPRTTLLELEQDTGISKTKIGRIVTEDLRLKKTPAKFIPRFLTNEQKLCRLATCEDMLEMTRTDPEWKDEIITGDETWVYGYDPETKRQSAEWRGQDIAPNDFFLFPKLKAVLKGRHFDTREDKIEKSLLALKSIPKEAYKNCFDNWEKRWRCINWMERIRGSSEPFLRQNLVNDIFNKGYDNHVSHISEFPVHGYRSGSGITTPYYRAAVPYLVQATIHAMETLRFPSPQECQDSSISKEGYGHDNMYQAMITCLYLPDHDNMYQAMITCLYLPGHDNMYQAMITCHISEFPVHGYRSGSGLTTPYYRAAVLYLCCFSRPPRRRGLLDRNKDG